MLFLLAALGVLATIAIVFWLAATDLAPLDSQTGKDNIRKYVRWWHAMIVVGAVILGAFVGSTSAAGFGYDDVVGGYQQFLNGVLVSADSSHYTCSRDGDCTHTYDCDPYTVVDQAAYTDSDGNFHPEESHTAYHDCPYATDEYSYWVTASFGFKTTQYTIDDHGFSSHPKEWHGDGGFFDSSYSGEGIPGGVFEGVPQDWIRYRSDIAHGNSDPVTQVGEYVNFVLSSQDTILRSYSDQVRTYLQRKLLPEHTAGILKGSPIANRWEADKISFIGFKPWNPGEWQRHLMSFNSALGMTLQGDLHIVAVKNSVIGPGESESYTNALLAYWQGHWFGKKALAKNGIIVVMGVDAGKSRITWARAKTGMPIGNGSMLAAIQNDLEGKPFSPTAILGNIKAKVTESKNSYDVNFVHSQGTLEQIVFNRFPFKRACMQCNNKSEKGQQSFVYLKADIKLPFWTNIVSFFIGVGFGLAGLLALFFATPDVTGFTMSGTSRSSYNSF